MKTIARAEESQARAPICQPIDQWLSVVIVWRIYVTLLLAKQCRGQDVLEVGHFARNICVKVICTQYSFPNGHKDC